MVEKRMTVTDGLQEIPRRPRNEEQKEEKQILALTIEQVCDGIKKLLKSGLNRRAILVLVRDASDVRMSEIEKVIDALEHLAERYCR